LAAAAEDDIKSAFRNFATARSGKAAGARWQGVPRGLVSGRWTHDHAPAPLEHQSGHEMLYVSDDTLLDANRILSAATPRPVTILPIRRAFAVANIPKIFNGVTRRFFFAGWNANRVAPYDAFHRADARGKAGDFPGDL